jgi:hypothetical protein
MFYWIYDVPTWYLAFLLAMLFVGFTWVGTILIRPFLRLLVRRQPNLNDLVGYILGAYGVFYGLLLGLIAVATYENSSDAEATVEQEAAALSALYRAVSHYPEPERSPLQAALRDYTRHVIQDGWPAYRRGVNPPESVAKVTAFQDLLYAFEPRTKGQELVHGETLRLGSEWVNARRLRLGQISAGIPPVLWYVVFAGAVLNIILIWAFEMRLALQLILGGLLALFMSMMVFVIAVLDNPFRGEVSVGPDAFVVVYERIMKPAGAGDAPEAPPASPPALPAASAAARP